MFPPNPRQPDPEQSIERGQYGSFPLSPKGGELQSECGVLYRDGLVTAQQEPNESKDRQEKGWHMLRLFVPNPLQVNLLREDAIMANDSLRPAEFNPILKRVVAEHCPSEPIRATGERDGTRRRSRGP